MPVSPWALGMVLGQSSDQSIRTVDKLIKSINQSDNFISKFVFSSSLRDPGTFKFFFTYPDDISSDVLKMIGENVTGCEGSLSVFVSVSLDY